MTGLGKSFAGVTALDGASLSIAPGEAHALIGQNGAGKSTLIKILTGVYRCDAGEVRLAGAPFKPVGPREAQAGGVSAIFQELNLIPLRSVTENIRLGHMPRTRLGLVDWRRAHDEAQAALGRLGVEIDVRRPLGAYDTALRQLVAIARAVSLEARLVVMDEPTSSLDAREVETLFGVIRALKASGVSVLYVTHFLDELFEVCDRVTVMRDGGTVGVHRITETTKLGLIAEMLGRRLEEIEAAGLTAFGGAGEASMGEPLLEALGVSAAPRLKRLTATVRRGEILGLGGLLGAGRTEAARAIFGADRRTEGEVKVKGRPLPPGSPRAAIRAGLGFLTEDRKSDGIVPERSIRENMTLALLPRLARTGRIPEAEERRIVERFIAALGVKAAHMDQPIRELSGGNQQKVLLARWLAAGSDALILDEPTRGVDVGAKREIQRIIRDRVAEGAGVVLISSEFEELVEGADRIIVMQDGRATGELRNPGVTEQALIAAVAETHEHRPPEAGG
jgi:ribose transport system ATP-binding protein